MVFACKKCKKTFRKDMTVYDDSDEYCPHCDNRYVRLLVFLRPFLHLSFQPRESIRELISKHLSLLLSQPRLPCHASSLQVVEAKTPQAMLVAEGEDSRKDNRYGGAGPSGPNKAYKFTSFSLMPHPSVACSFDAPDKQYDPRRPSR